MIRDALFVLISIVTCLFLFITLPYFISFLSSQKIQENSKDASIFTLFTTDVCLVVLFMAQHSGLASKWFSSLMNKIGLQVISRSVYILTTTAAVQFLMNAWQPIPDISFWLINTSEAPMLWLFFNILHWVLWIALFLEVWAMKPGVLCGVRQVYNYINGWYPSSFYLPPKLQKVLTDMPHPGGGCFMAILWLHPCMTFDRMILATVLTAYLWCGYGVTERDYVYMKSYTTSKYSRKVHREKAIYYHER